MNHAAHKLSIPRVRVLLTSTLSFKKLATQAHHIRGAPAQALTMLNKCLMLVDVPL